MNNINILPGNQFAEIVISCNISASPGDYCFQMILIDIANSKKACTFIADVALPHTSDTDNTFCQFIARRCKTTTSEYLPGNDRKSNCGSSSFFQEAASARFFLFHRL